jgi:protein-tyrosine phosphatase
MIDIHCHILPDFDDGASNLDEALEMAEMAANSGITDIIATPHFRGEPSFLENQIIIDRRFQTLSDAIRRSRIPVQLHRGAEILCLPETAKMASAHQLPTLAGTDYVLIEFYFNEPFSFMDDMLFRIAKCGYRPVVAHPERYNAIQRDPELLLRWAELGYVLQLNKGSVLGDLGFRAEQTANEILSMGLAHLFASDAHHSYTRTPHMGSLRRWVNEFCDTGYAAALLKENPSALLQNQSLNATVW